MIPAILNKPLTWVLSFLLLFFSHFSQAQIKIDTTLSPAKLVKNVLLGEGVVVGNVKFTGPKHAIGLFKDSTKILSIHEGVLLTTGNVFMAPGPNKEAGMSWVSKAKGFNKLDSISMGETHDAAILEFDFVTSAEALTFNFIFASEEYPEYVDSKYNDVFGFFIHGPGLNHVNLATLPRSKVPVTINSINHKTNKKYFVNNPTFTYNDRILYDVRLKRTTKNKNFGKEGGLPKYNIQFDGFTTVLEAVCRVVPGEVYHIQMAIADVGDFSLDSGVFLEAHSFRSSGSSYVSIKNPFQNPTGTLDGFGPEELSEAGPTGNKHTPIKPSDVNEEKKIFGNTFKVEFEFDSCELTDSAKVVLDKVCDWLMHNPETSVKVTGHTDYVGSYAYNDQLSQCRALIVADFLAAKSKQTQISNAFKGEKQPIESNQSETGRAMNRRVEIQIMK